MLISILHPSRSRPQKSSETFHKWSQATKYPQGSIWLCSLDEDEDVYSYVEAYRQLDMTDLNPIVSKNKSAVDAINNAAKHWRSDEANLFIVVSDDTEPCQHWDDLLLKELEGKKDFILKTQDGIQDWIITMPVLDREYYKRTGYIYDPDFKHMFCDTWLTVQADISGRKLTSNLMFRHLNDTIKDDVRKRSDATWDEGQRIFIQKLKQTPVEDLRKITDQSMKNWIRNYAGIRL